MDLVQLFDSVATRMRADLEATRASLSHPGLKGGAFEDSFRRFLRDYMPAALDVSTGVLVDADGRQSRQLDVIISDAAKTPIFYASGDLRVIPVECAYMVIEVKARLDPGDLEGCFQNMLSVRRLVKSAYLPESNLIIRKVRAYGGQHPIWPVNYFVFAYDSVPLMTVAESIRERTLAEGLPLTSRLDTVCVLNQGVICNRLADGTFSALPEPGSSWQVCRTSKSLLLFYALLSNYFNQAQLPNFRFKDYLGKLEFTDLGDHP
jgi:hypothetical protein